MKHRLLKLLIDDAGQDLIEYALLASVIGFAAVAAVGVLSSTMNATYTSWDTATQGLWEPSNPSTPLP